MRKRQTNGNSSNFPSSSDYALRFAFPPENNLMPDLSRRTHIASSIQVLIIRAALFVVGSNDLLGDEVLTLTCYSCYYAVLAAYCNPLTYNVAS